MFNHLLRDFWPAQPGWSLNVRLVLTVIAEAVVFVSLLLMVPLYILVLAPR